MVKIRIQILLLLFSFPLVISAAADEICMYQTSEGKTVQVNSRLKIPKQYRAAATCFKTKKSTASPGPKREIYRPEHKPDQRGKTSQQKPWNFSGSMAKPEDIDLAGTVRREDMASSLGRIELRWPRKIEILFGRTPKRAMADAARTASRALKSAGFAPELRSLDLDWKVIFLDAELSSSQIPSYLINNCHPAWMTGPANMYFVGQRIVSGCGDEKSLPGRVADAKLAQVILHEIGHVIEYQLLKGIGSYDRMRAEGFATWFEQYAGDYSSMISKGKVSAEHIKRAQTAIRKSPDYFRFQGSAYDYSRASMYFRAAVAKRRVAGLMEVYQTIRQKRLSFIAALKDTYHWSDKRIKEEVAKAARL